LGGLNPQAYSLCLISLAAYDRRATQLTLVALASPSSVGSPASTASPRPSKKTIASPSTQTLGVSSPVLKANSNVVPDYGVCKGFCLSVFFGKPCPKLTANRPCIYSSSTPLSHEPTFRKLPGATQSSMRSHFDLVIKPSLTQSMINFYN
jgi:hypothetical protein